MRPLAALSTLEANFYHVSNKSSSDQNSTCLSLCAFTMKNLLLILTCQSPGNLHRLWTIIAHIFLVKSSPDLDSVHISMCLYTQAKSSSSACSPQRWCHSYPQICLPGQISIHQAELFSLIISASLSLCLSFGITLSTSLSLYSSATLCIIFSCSFLPCFSPLLHWLTLFHPLFLCSSSPLAFGGFQTISVFREDFIALFSQCATQALFLMFSFWWSSSMACAINNWKFCMVSLLLFSNSVLSPSPCL